MSELESFLLYFLIFITTTICGYLSQRNINQKNIKNTKVFKIQWLLLSFMIHLVFVCFSNIGADYDSYINHSKSIYWGYILKSSAEWGYLFYIWLLKQIFVSPDICVFFLKATTITINYYCFYKFRKHLDIGLAIFAFNMILFYRLYYLLSMLFASSLLLLSFIHLFKGKNIASLFYLLLAFSIHASSIFLLPFYILCFICNRFYRKSFSSFEIVIILFLILVLFEPMLLLASNILENISFFKHYIDYLNRLSPNASGLGFLIYLPVIYFTYLIPKSSLKSSSKNCIVIFLLSWILFRIAGYKYSIINRMIYHFESMFCLAIPCLFYSRLHPDNPYERTSFVFSYRTDYIIWLAFLLCVGCLETYTMFFLTNSNGNICNYVFFNPFL